MVWHCLPGNCKDADGKAIKFQDFDEAMLAANNTDGCGGITKTSTGYSLRKGKKTKSNPVGSRSGMASWTKKSGITTSELTTETVEKPKSPKKKVDKPKKKLSQCILPKENVLCM